MKRNILPVFMACTVLAAICTLSGMNEYECAKVDAAHSEGSDGAITEILHNHGFQMDALENRNPTIAEYITASFTSKSH